MNKKIILIIEAAIFIVLFSACKETCHCTVEWTESHRIGTSNNYRKTTMQDEYIVYPKDKFTECETALEKEFGVKHNHYGVGEITCYKRN